MYCHGKFVGYRGLLHFLSPLETPSANLRTDLYVACGLRPAGYTGLDREPPPTRGAVNQLTS